MRRHRGRAEASPDAPENQHRGRRIVSPWRRAPRAAWSSPLTVLVAAVTALLSCFLAGAAVLHASAAGGATVALQSEVVCPDAHGPSIVQRGVTPADATTTIDAARRHAAEFGFGEPRVAMYTPNLNTDFRGEKYLIRLGYTDGGLDQLDQVTGTRDPGLWMGLDLSSQANLPLGVRGAAEQMPPVVGTYRDLTNPAPRWWCSQQRLAVQQRLVDPAGGAVIFATDRTSFEQAVLASSAPALEELRITFPGDAPATVAQAADQVDRSTGLIAAVREDLGGGRGLDTGIPFSTSTQIAEKAEANVTGSILPLAVLSVLVGLGGIGAVGLQWYQRRYTHVRLLVARGSGPVALGALAAAELGGALVLGGGAGIVLARVLLGFYGPPGAASVGAQLWSVVVAAAVLLLSVLVLAAVVAVRVHREFQLGRVAGTRGRRMLVWVPWELLAAALAMLGWMRLGQASSSIRATDPVPSIDPLALTYPVFVVLTAGLLAARLAWLLLVASHRARFWSRPALQMAIRRLAGARAPVTGVLVIGVLAIGTLAAGSGIADGQRAALETKSGMFVGANSRADTETPIGTGARPLPEALRDNSTVVGEVTGNGSVVLVVDPKRLERHGWLGDLDPALLSRLGPAGPAGIPALRVAHRPGQNPALPGLVNAAPVAELPMFPIIGAQPGYVISRTALTPAQLAAVPKWTVLSSLPVDTLTATLEAARLAHPNPLGRDTALEALPFRLVEWTFSFVVVLGGVLGVVAILTLLVAVEVRRRQNALAGALVLRMGMRPRTLLSSHLIEQGVLTGIASLVGVACGVAVAAISAPRFDPARWLTPRSALPDPTWFVLGVFGTALVVVSVAGWIAVRSVRTARTAELLRA